MQGKATGYEESFILAKECMIELLCRAQHTYWTDGLLRKLLGIIGMAVYFDGAAIVPYRGGKPLFQCAALVDCGSTFEARYPDYRLGLGMGLWRESVLFRISDLVPAGENTQQYLAVFRPKHWDHAMRYMLIQGRTCLGIADFFRERGEENFSMDDVRHLRSALPQFLEAVSLVLENCERTTEQTRSLAMQNCFGLTDVETKILQWILEGLDLQEIYRSAGGTRTLDACRKIRQAVFAKTGTKNSRALRTLSGDPNRWPW